MRATSVCPVYDPDSLTTASNVPRRSGRYPEYRTVLQWIETFVLQPHAELNRAGAVCPRLAPSLRRDAVRLVSITSRSSTPHDAYRIGLGLAQLYRTLFSTPEQFRIGALLAVFPDLAPADAPAFIDQGHTLLKPEFVAQGLMLGEFHPDSPVTSVRNPNLHVMRCPVPMLAVRALSRHDLAFLDTPDTAPDIRAQYLQDVLAFIGDQLAPHERERIRTALTNTPTSSPTDSLTSSSWKGTP